jgi:hypothetical protein
MTVYEINSQFAGRIEDSDTYAPGNRIHIHPRNRAFVWKQKHIDALEHSLVNGFYIPAIICSGSSKSNRLEVLDGGNRITAIRKMLESTTLSDEKRRKIEFRSINVVVLNDPDNKQIVEQFRRLNKSIKVSDGQLYSMYEESPLVQAAQALLNDPYHPLRDVMDQVFSPTLHNDNAGKKTLENAVALVSGAINGVPYITKSFDRQEFMVAKTEPINIHRITAVLGDEFDVFVQANDVEEVESTRQMKAQFTVGKFLGPILYDVLTLDEPIQAIQTKWKRYILRVRRCVSRASDAIELGGANNITPDRLAKISKKVQRYLDDKHIMTKEELVDTKHVVSESQSDDETATTEDSDEE